MELIRVHETVENILIDMFKRKEKLNYNVVKLYMDISHSDVNDFNKNYLEEILDVKKIKKKTEEFLKK
jgi:hypothetical protein